MRTIGLKLTSEELRWLLWWVQGRCEGLEVLERVVLWELCVRQCGRSVVGWKGKRKVNLRVSEAVALRGLLRRGMPGSGEPYLQGLLARVSLEVEGKLAGL